MTEAAVRGIASPIGRVTDREILMVPWVLFALHPGIAACYLKVALAG